VQAPVQSAIGTHHILPGFLLFEVREAIQDRDASSQEQGYNQRYESEGNGQDNFLAQAYGFAY